MVIINLKKPPTLLECIELHHNIFFIDHGKENNSKFKNLFSSLNYRGTTNCKRKILNHLKSVSCMLA